MTAVHPHRPITLIGVIGAQQTWVWPDDSLDSPWIGYREGLARLACSSCELPTCAGCGAPLDRHPAQHSPRCAA